MKDCEYCKKLISDNVAWFSLREYGHELCIEHQIAFKSGRLTDKDIENKNNFLTKNEEFCDYVEDQRRCRL